MVVSDELFFWEGGQIYSWPSIFHAVFKSNEIGVPAVDTELGKFILPMHMIDIIFIGPS